MGTRRLAAGCVIVALSVAGCGSGTAPGNGTGSGGSAVPARTSQPELANPSPTPPAGRCATAQQRITVPADGGRDSACLVIGATLVIETPAAPNQPWQPLTTSDARVLPCVSRRSAAGGSTATCRAAHTGRAILITTTASFSGDPHGPGQREWQLNAVVRS